MDCLCYVDDTILLAKTSTEAAVLLKGFPKALDRFDLHGPDSLDATLSAVTAPGLVVGFTSDWLYPSQGNREVAEALLRVGKDATYAELAMDFGHDSFLLRSPELYDLIRCFLVR